MQVTLIKEQKLSTVIQLLTYSNCTFLKLSTFSNGLDKVDGISVISSTVGEFSATMQIKFHPFSFLSVNLAKTRDFASDDLNFYGYPIKPNPELGIRCWLFK